ncbi:universal stress protein [Dermacoccaceae bacterium W4C1]
MSVVLGYDESQGSQTALRTALSVAAKFDEELVLVYGAAPPGGVGEEFKVHQAALEQMGRAALESAVSAATAAGVTSRIELVDAKPVDALLSVADACDASVIIVGVVGTSPLRSAILGSTPHKLLHLSTRPVLCVPLDADLETENDAAAPGSA